MKERDELTSKPNSSNLEREGDIMDGPNGSPEQPPRGQNPEEQRRQGEKQQAREELFSLGSLPEDANVEVRRAYEEHRNDLLKRTGILGSATWKNKDNDTPVEVIDYAGLGPDGRQYVYIQSGDDERRTGIPLDELEYPNVDTSQELGLDGGFNEPPNPPVDENASSEEPEEDPEKRRARIMAEDEERMRDRLAANADETRGWARRCGISDDVIEEFIKDTQKEVLQHRADMMKSRIEKGIEAPITVPESLEDLARLIMKRSAPQWRRGADLPPGVEAKPLLNEDGTVNTVNFLDWSRHNLLRVHNNNPKDPVNFFSDIGTNIRTDLYGGAISFYEITFGESYFLQDKGNGEKVVNKEYQALHDQLLMETFLLMSLRSPDITYTTTARSQQKEMLDALTAAMIKNPLTRSNFLEIIITMPSTHRESILDLVSEDEKRKILGEDSSQETMFDLRAKQEGNFYVGTAVRRAISAYMNMHSYEQLVKILGEDSPFLRLEFAERQKDGSFKERSIEKDPKPNGKDRESWFYSDKDVENYRKMGVTVVKGRPKLGTINKRTGKWDVSSDGRGEPNPDYMDYLNLFLGVSPDQKQQAEIRERMRDALVEKEGISYEEAEFAELFAYSMTHINGIAAREDKDSVAFDWWTRLTNFRDKRKREKAERRNSKYGNRFNLEGLKRIGLTFFEAARDTRGRSIRSILQGGTGEKIDIDNNPIKNVVKYETEAGNESLIVFYNPQGQKIDGLHAADYEIHEVEEIVEGKTVKNSKVRFKDSRGEIIDVGENVPRVTKERVTKPIEFTTDLEKQFVPTHLRTSAKVYDWIIENVQLHLPEIVIGYDTHQNPIIDQKKVDEIKEGLMHDLRYVLSTWGEINFEEEDMEWEKHEVRNERGQLIAKKEGKLIERIATGNKDEKGEEIFMDRYEELYLDEEWYVLDENGNRTEEKNEPKTYVESRIMTKLESMFGVDALRYIQYEVEKRGLKYEQLEGTKKEKAKENKKTITGRDWQGKEQTVVVDMTFAGKDEEFKTAVWRGTFDYIVAAEIASHRTRGSGYEWYDSGHISRSVDALVEGGLMTPDQVKQIRVETKTRARNLYPADIGYVFAAGGLEGFFKALRIAYADLLK